MGKISDEASGFSFYRLQLRARASSIDLIFPGHDLMMHNNFPKVAEYVTQLV
ncbi:MAG: hypothetical protein ACLP5H_15055 [Desulfomonilaceae bacterium]